MPKEITVFHKKEFRKWLMKNHDKKRTVSIILYKKHTGKKSPTHRDLMEEAICFGWIDTTVKRVDEDRYMRNFVRRNKNSKWSDNTLSYAKELIKQGKMTPSGLKIYKLGLQKPTHDHGISKNPDIPPELRKALEKDKKAKENFKKFSVSAKRTIYRWILRGKREETRSKRIKLVVKGARDGKNAVFGTQDKING